jgi:Flp pilus assembly secretin CpaC
MANPEEPRLLIRSTWLVPFLGALLLAPLALVSPLAVPPAIAAGPDISLRMGQTIVLTVPEGVDRVVTGDGEIVDVKPLPGNRQLLVSARKPGVTNFLVWPSRARGGGDDGDAPARNYQVEVTSFRRTESITIRARILEVLRGNDANVGFDWADGISWVEAPPNAPFRLGLPARSGVLDAKLNLLIQERKARLLAQPTLVTTSGQPARFLAGGEIPIPLILQNSISVEWKPYGVRLDIEPRLEGTDTIILKVRPEVSRIDQTNAIKLPNVTVPAVATRWTESTLQLRNGETVVLSALTLSDDQKAEQALPLLSSIPFLGELFKNHENKASTTELIFQITPTVAERQPLQPESGLGRQP